MKIILRSLFAGYLLLAGSWVFADESRLWVAEAAGFEASITGSYEGQVSSAGVVQFLPAAGFNKQGYYFLADGRGLRPHGVTFILPKSVKPGKLILASPSPLDLGTVASVRVDRDLGDATASYQNSTKGFLNLEAFPANENAISGQQIKGTFEFTTKGARGQTVTVKGRFSFKAK